MAELCLMASHGYPPGVFRHPSEHGVGRISRECSYLLSNYGLSQDSARLCLINQRMHQTGELWKPAIEIPENNRFFKTNLSIRRPVLDIEDCHPNLILFSFKIIEQYTRRERALKFLLSEASDVESGGIDASLLLDLMGPQALISHTPQEPLLPFNERSCVDAELQPSIVSPLNEFSSEKPLVLADLGHSYQTHLPDGQLSFTSSTTEMKNILRTFTEIYVPNNSMKWKKQPMLVPYHDRRLSRAKTVIDGSSAKLETMKSFEKVKYKTSSKKKSNMKTDKETDLYRNSYMYACESLISIMVDKKRHGRNAIHSIKRSGPEIPKLLTQFSASIAGTGLAVLFSVVCKVACGRVPFCASKLLSTGLGLGLVWLSWAVNKLRDTVISINRNSGKLGNGEEEIMSNLDRSIREIYLRAVTLVAIAVLKLA